MATANVGVSGSFENGVNISAGGMAAAGLLSGSAKIRAGPVEVEIGLEGTEVSAGAGVKFQANKSGIHFRAYAAWSYGAGVTFNVTW